MGWCMKATLSTDFSLNDLMKVNIANEQVKLPHHFDINNLRKETKDPYFNEFKRLEAKLMDSLENNRDSTPEQRAIDMMAGLSKICKTVSPDRVTTLRAQKQQELSRSLTKETKTARQEVRKLKRMKKMGLRPDITSEDMRSKEKEVQRKVQKEYRAAQMEKVDKFIQKGNVDPFKLHKFIKGKVY